MGRRKIQILESTRTMIVELYRNHGISVMVNALRLNGYILSQHVIRRVLAEDGVPLRSQGRPKKS